MSKTSYPTETTVCLMFSLSDQDTLPVTYHTPTGVFLFGEDGVQVSADTTVYEKQTDDSLPSLTSQDIEHLQEGGYPDTSDSPEAPDTESGSASVVHESVSGTRTILENLLEGDIFGSLFYFHANRGNIFVEATKDCSVRFIDYDHLIKRCENACAHHSQLVNNVLIMIQEKTKQVCEHLEVLSQRSIRDRLLCYFDILSRQNNSMTFEIPFTITNMADYLSIDRSAMSREIGKLKDEKILDLNKRKVTLLKTDLF